MTDTPRDARPAPTRLRGVDRALYALFARHADGSRHAADRDRYRGLVAEVSFDVFLARVYGLSWVVAWLVTAACLPVAAAVAPPTVAGVPLPDGWPAVAGVTAAGAGSKRLTVVAAGRYLRARASARRSRIRRSLPGVARYLDALSSGSDGPRAMLRRVAESDAYGETGRSIRRALNTAELTGSLRRGLGRVARDTPSREVLSPFLLKFREHASQGDDALSNYLRLESRVLGRRRERTSERNADLMELLAELFVVTLVLPALLVVVLTVVSVLAPSLSEPVATPVGRVTRRTLVTVAAAGFVVCVGAAAAAAVERLRPTDTRVGYGLPDTPRQALATAATDPASAAVVWVLPSLALGVAVWSVLPPVDGVLAWYVTFAVPVGAVGLRRARLDDAKDREIKDFVHAVSGHVGLGRPLPEAVERVAREVDLGPLAPDVDDLAFNLVHGSRRETDLRTAALNRFVDRVGTPLAARSVGLVTGALDAGSDSEAVFETLQTEVSRLYHERRALRSSLLVYVVVGWTTALLVVGIVLVVTTQVLDGFTQLSAVSDAGGVTLDPDAVDPARARRRFYLVTQATVVASGWFAGAADRGPFAALLHSGLLVGVTAVAFEVVA